MKVVAILNALQHAQHCQGAAMIVHTDSQMTLQTLQQTCLRDSISLTSTTLGILQSLAAQCRRVLLN